MGGMELSSGEIYAFEVKASATYKADQFRGLTYLRDKLGDRFLGGFVLGTAPQGYRFADKLWGLPVSGVVVYLNWLPQPHRGTRRA